MPNCTTEPYYQKQHGTKPDMSTNGIEDPEINPCSYSYVSLNKGAKNHTLKKRQPL
jgi:hypothetical protein